METHVNCDLRICDRCCEDAEASVYCVTTMPSPSKLTSEWRQISTANGANRRHDESSRRAGLKRASLMTRERERCGPVHSQWARKATQRHPFGRIRWLSPGPDFGAGTKFLPFSPESLYLWFLAGLLTVLLKSLSSGIRRSGYRRADRALSSSSLSFP